MLESREHTFFGESLKALRFDRKMSQWDLAKAIGVHERTVVSWEAGDSNPSEGNYQKICAYFQIDPKDSHLEDALKKATLEQLMKEIDRRGFDIGVSVKKRT